MSSSSSSKRKLSSYDAFSAVDSLVSKPVMGSDGAASWQEFNKSQKTQSRGVAPHMPLKRSDRLSGMTSIHHERVNEQSIRKSGGDRDMGSGYTVFKRKGGNAVEQKANAVERKRLKLIQERTRPDDAKYFIKTETGTFEGWKEDYIFTTRDRGTGYYWDGMDSLKKLNNTSNVKDDCISGDLRDGVETKSKSGKDKSTKRKRKKKSSSRKGQDNELPSGWAEAIDPHTGKVYYYNRSLNQTVWERPVKAAVETDKNVSKRRGDGANVDTNMREDNNACPSAVSPLPSGWAEAIDPHTGKVYYYNRSLNQTVWERPVKAAVETDTNVSK